MRKSPLHQRSRLVLSLVALVIVAPALGADRSSADASGGWLKFTNNPVLGGSLGTCFDVSVLKEEGKFRMWFSWRPKKSVALVESTDGIQWSSPREISAPAELLVSARPISRGEPQIVLGPNPETDWENDINRPAVLKRGGTYHIWYTGQARKRSWIGYATSRDGVSWTRRNKDPVLSADSPWEKNIAVMCPHVIWDEPAQLYRMWYSGGEQYEPNAIGCASSPDGLNWTKHPDNPIFRADKANAWEQDRVTGCQVVREGDWHVMFYIGFADEHFAQIGLARSRDGITGWERHPQNPIIRARLNPEAWDFDACYKPYALFHEGRWRLWYNGRRGNVEQIGLATHEGRALWPKPAPVKGPTATINSYLFGDALAIARVADLAGKPELAREFRDKAAQLKQLVQERLWDDTAKFFKVLARGENTRLSDVRELHGYTPWYFGLPDASLAVAWRQITDPQGFYAPFGPTTAEQRHPQFAVSYQGHECQWNGPSWPYATAVTLTALANLLNGPAQEFVSARDYFDLLRIYAQSHRLQRDDGRVAPWIDENLNPLTGDWLARTRLKTWKNGNWDPSKGGVERGKDYNHSTFCDLIITGLVGLRPSAATEVEVNPLVPAGSWDWFCLDGLAYHGHTLTILWDKTGQMYGRGAGLRVLADGQEIARAPQLQRVSGKLP